MDECKTKSMKKNMFDVRNEQKKTPMYPIVDSRFAKVSISNQF